MTTYREELEAWLREPLPSDPRERAQEEAARALVKGGLEGALSWTQVYHAMHVIEDEASARRLDQVERVYDALRPDDENRGAGARRPADDAPLRGAARRAGGTDRGGLADVDGAPGGARGPGDGPGD
jgi:hypothetical protein